MSNAADAASASASITTTSFDESDDSLFTVNLTSPMSTFSILTTVTSSAATVSAWLSDVLSCSPSPLIVGLDVEWRPSFSSYQHNPVALLQLCVSATKCLLFQLLYADAIPSDLLAFLQNPNLRFVGVGIGEDVEKLVEDHDIIVKNTVDLRTLAAQKLRKKEAKQMGIAKLSMEVMGMEVKKPKRITMSRWDQATLMLDQIGYACVDAFLSFEIGRRLFASATSSSDGHRSNAADTG